MTRVDTLTDSGERLLTYGMKSQVSALAEVMQVSAHSSEEALH
jgi:hypothetical protein